MKRVALAIAVSVGAHAGLWFLVKDALLGTRVAPETQPVEFTITETSPSPVGRGAREAGGEGRAAAKPTPKPQTNTSVVQNRETPSPATETAGDESSVVEVEIAGGEAGGPHPDPLPQAGEGDGQGALPAVKVDDAALVHARLAEAARRCYPAAARRFRQRGTVTLSFCADPSGGVIEAAVKESSGASLLDDSALHCVLEAAAPLPPEAASHCYAVPVRFDAQ